MNKLKIALVLSIVLNVVLLAVLVTGFSTMEKDNEIDPVEKALSTQEEKTLVDLGAVWPADVQMVTQYFDPVRHLAIDIPQATDGATNKISNSVFAVLDGEVTTASCDSNGGYGCEVVLKHSEDLQTLYAHNSELKVRVGDKVKKGQLIAKMGATGTIVKDESSPQLHFEVIYKNEKIDPLKLFPSQPGNGSVSDKILPGEGGGKVFIYVYSISKSIFNIKNELTKISGVKISDDIKYTENNKIAEMNFVYTLKQAEDIDKILSKEATDKIVYGAKTLWAFGSEVETKLETAMHGKVVLTDVGLLKK